MAASGVKSRLKKQRSKRRRLKIRPRTNLKGGDLVRSTFLVLTFAFALAFMATFVLALILAFLSPFGGSVLTFLLGNGEKGRILSQSGVIPFGAFGWAFARAHSDLRRRFTFHRSWLKAGVYCARRGSRDVFFCSLLLECDLLAKKVPGRAPFSQHNIFRNWT